MSTLRKYQILLLLAVVAAPVGLIVARMAPVLFWGWVSGIGAVRPRPYPSTPCRRHGTGSSATIQEVSKSSSVRARRKEKDYEFPVASQAAHSSPSFSRAVASYRAISWAERTSRQRALV